MQLEPPHLHGDTFSFIWHLEDKQVKGVISYSEVVDVVRQGSVAILRYFITCILNPPGSLAIGFQDKNECQRKLLINPRCRALLP